MREIGLLISNYLLFTFMGVALSAMQASLWFNIFGFSPAPYLFLIVPTYWVLYRSAVESLIMVYLTSYVLVSMSGVPLVMSFAANISVFATLYMLRDRVLWKGVNSFVLACGLSSVLHYLFIFIWSFIIEEKSTENFYFFNWIVSSLLTAAIAAPFHYLFLWCDRITQKDIVQSAETDLT